PARAAAWARPEGCRPPPTSSAPSGAGGDKSIGQPGPRIEVERLTGGSGRDAQSEADARNISFSAVTPGGRGPSLKRFRDVTVAHLTAVRLRRSTTAPRCHGSSLGPITFNFRESPFAIASKFSKR